MARQPRDECLACVHFRNDPAYLEAVIQGLPSLGSGYASVRGDDGLCLRHDRYVGARNGCADFLRVTIAAETTPPA